MTNPAHIPARRRGFIFLLVLLVVAVGAIIIAGGINRANVEANIVQRQLDGYQQHHELLGIRDLVLFWVTREQGDNKLAEYANAREPATRMVLPENVAVIIHIRDGQGTLRARLQQGDAPEVAGLLIDVLSYLPTQRADLLRKAGPLAVSLRAAPDEVITAISRGNPEVESVLRKLRDDDKVHRGIFVEELQRAGVSAEEIQLLSELVSFDQTRLWRIDVEIVDARGSRWYTGLAEMERNLPNWVEWKADPGRGVQQFDSEGQPVFPDDGHPASYRDPQDARTWR